MSRNKKNKRLGLERLERRDTPAQFGIPWVDAQNVSLSFAPDKTVVSGAASNLFDHMNNDGLNNSAWQGEVLRAVQAWTSQTNINVDVVSDDGSAIGAAGLSQHDSRFGDIRVSMRALDSGVLAITTPPGTASGTQAGDIILNSNYHFSIGAKAGSYDLYTVVLQEAGHAFGMGNSPVTSSVMYEQYQGVRSGLDATDSANIRVLYGDRAADAFEGAGGNDTRATATSLNRGSNKDAFYAKADVASAADVDYYKFVIVDPKDGDKDTTVNLRADGNSLLSGNVSVMDASGKVLAVKSASGKAGVDLSFPIKLRTNTVYYVAVQASAGTVFSAGAYELSVTTDKGSLDPATAADTQTYTNDAGTNETLATASVLKAVAGTTSLAHYSELSKLASPTDVDFYRADAPAGAGQTTLVASVVSTASGLAPQLSFYSSTGQLLAAEQVSNDGTSRVYQIRNVADAAQVFVRVGSGGSLTGSSYALQVDYAKTGIDMPVAATSTLSGASPVAFHTLQIAQAQVFNFSFLAQAQGASSPTTVWVSLYDRSGKVVSTFSATPGLATSQKVLLNPGEYAFKISATFSATAAPVDYALRMTTLSDPIGIMLTDPTMTTTPTTTTTVAPPPINMTSPTTTTATTAPVYMMPTTTMPPATMPPATTTTTTVATTTTVPTTTAVAPPPPINMSTFSFYTYDRSYYSWLTPMM